MQVCERASDYQLDRYVRLSLDLDEWRADLQNLHLHRSNLPHLHRICRTRRLRRQEVHPLRRLIALVGDGRDSVHIINTIL